MTDHITASTPLVCSDERHAAKTAALEQEIARLRAGEEDGWDPAVYPTPGQWIARFNHATPQQRHDAARSAIDSAQKANDCVLSNHRGQLAEQHQVLVALAGERDGAYRERAHLVALLAAHYPSVIAPAPDIEDEPGWQILYLRIGGRQCSWHIAPRDAELFAHVEHVPADDRRAQWDGHTTEEKYAHISERAAQLHAEARARVDTPTEA